MGQRVLSDEQRRLRYRSFTQLAFGFSGLTLGLIQKFTQIKMQMRLQDLAALIHSLPEDTLKLIKLNSHSDVLGALSRKHESYCRFAPAVRTIHDSPRSAAGQHGGRIRHVPAHDKATFFECSATDGTGVGDVGKVQLRVLLQVRRQIRRYGVEGSGCFRRKKQQLPGATFVRWIGNRRFFEDYVRVRTANAETTNACVPRTWTSRPGRKLVVDEKRTIGKVDARVRLFEVQARWQQLVLQRQHRFNEPGDACRYVKMSDVC